LLQVIWYTVYVVYLNSTYLAYRKVDVSNFYPKKDSCLTTIDEDGYPSYRHHDNCILMKKMELD